MGVPQGGILTPVLSAAEDVSGLLRPVLDALPHRRQDCFRADCRRQQNERAASRLHPVVAGQRPEEGLRQHCNTSDHMKACNNTATPATTLQHKRQHCNTSDNTATPALHEGLRQHHTTSDNTATPAKTVQHQRLHEGLQQHHNTSDNNATPATTVQHQRQHCNTSDNSETPALHEGMRQHCNTSDHMKACNNTATPATTLQHKRQQCNTSTT